MVEAGSDLQHGTLAAAGWANEHANLSRAKRKVEIGEHVGPLAGRVFERLACDINLKLHGAATLIPGFQPAATGRYKSTAPPPQQLPNTPPHAHCATID